MLMPKKQSESRLEFRPATPARWKDLVALFGERGACGGCWCMYWRLTRPAYEKSKGNGNKRAFKKLVDSGIRPGLLAYVNGQPAGWCSFGPREDFQVLERSRILERVDQQPVWSIVCFFVAKPFRRKGLTVELLKAAVKHAAGRGANIVEGYANDPSKGISPDVFVYTGLVSAFRKAGFVEVLRRSKNRPIMRYKIKNQISKIK